MSLPAPVSSKLAKLIPRLATDSDGEIVATVRAIRRTLDSAGKDLHDLARRLSFDPPEPESWAGTYEPPQTRSGPWRWQNLARHERVLALDGISGLRLSAWERQFVGSIDTLLRSNPSARVSPRQQEVLNNLLQRAWEEEQ